MASIRQQVNEETAISHNIQAPMEDHGFFSDTVKKNELLKANPHRNGAKCRNLWKLGQEWNVGDNNIEAQIN